MSLSTAITTSTTASKHSKNIYNSICKIISSTRNIHITTTITTTNSLANTHPNISQPSHSLPFSLSSKRYLSAYASVNHSNEYKNEMEGRHGQQLQLALKEAQKYEMEDIDPFELYRIGSSDSVDVDDYDDDGDSDSDSNSNSDNDNDTDDNNGIDEGNDSDEENEEEDDVNDGIVLSNYYTNDGQPKRSKAELTSYKAGAPSGGSFAIISLNGSQQKVTLDDVIIVNKLKPVNMWSVGSIHTLNASNGQVLLLGSQDKTLVGLPFVNGGEVDVMVEEITRDKKVIVFKKKRRKNYRRKNGFKREVTFLRVLDIRFP